MAASLFGNALQVDFDSVLAMEHAGMVQMFKNLEETGLKGFLTASDLVYESAVVEFFANAKMLAGTIVSFVANKKVAITKESFIEAFGLQIEGMFGFLGIQKETVDEMRIKFSRTDAPFRTPSKKKQMKMEFRILHDIVAKAPFKDGSFDMVTSEKFDLMVAITVGLKVNWAQVLFQVLLNMVNTPKCQSHGFAIQISVLVQNVVKEDLGELVKLHLQKVWTSKSVQIYIKKKSDVKSTGETSTQQEDTERNNEGNETQSPR
ncbi:hypothetical protein F511_33030 [Dorcoceras hygrometricum]|uniref:Dystroglycan-like n=1 Tax=Dorcoceras hygrometricum TaxID=472368 RepID=A0A2Z7CC86_9LAMI|nr:hypothetical protein F511_33030 [Dorcoceras hygrometricum]